MIVYREIAASDAVAHQCALMVQKYSWGLSYPVSAVEEFKSAEYIVAAFDGAQLVACASLNRQASPDGVGNGELWLADAVVLPHYRRQGIFKQLYQRCLVHVTGRVPTLWTCSDNSVIEEFLLHQGWSVIRTTKDESGGSCRVFCYNIPR